ncbi:MAG: DNA polymerase III subunit gamma/tau [Coriobacteriia bacterium]|nr:DNA polymerase III subunit gamma/tau [Coriobacteriia bacterium]
MAEALYRKYRPQVFADVVGQDHIEQTLKNAIEQDKVSHAYLFCGPRGTGKTTTARLLAKALLCEHGPTSAPDGTCEDCRMIARGEHPDVYELDAASRTGVDNVREEIINRVMFAPTRGSYKIYIIDEVHMLSTAAFNALLKTLEEPPSHVVFMLCTTDPQKVPETIHSRCQRFDFRRISSEFMVARLGAICEAEGVAFDGAALELIAHRAEGGMRNALTALEQVISFGNGVVSMAAAEDVLGSLDSSDLSEIVALIGTRDVAGCFAWVANYVETGSDLAQFTRDLAEHTRNLYVMSLTGSDAPLDVNDALRAQMAEQLQWFGPDRLARMMGVLGDLTVELKTSTNPRLSFEIACTRLVRPDSDLTLEGLAERIEALESGYSAVAHVSAGAAAARPQPAAQPAVAAQPQREAQPAVAVQPQPSQQAEPVRTTGVIATTAEPEPEPVAHLGNAQSLLENPASLQRAWASAMSLLKRDKPAYAVLLMNAKAEYDPAKKTLLVQFAKDSAFAYKAVQKPEVSEDLDQVLQRTFGEHVPFSYVQVSDAQQDVAAQPVAAAPRETQSQSQPQQAATPQRTPQPAAAQPQPAAAQPVPAELQRSSAAPAPSQPEPFYEEVPLDAYDSYAPAPAPAAAAESRPAPASAAEPQPQPAAAPAPAPANESPEKMADMLSEVFGAPVRFNE